MRDGDVATNASMRSICILDAHDGQSVVGSFTEEPGPWRIASGSSSAPDLTSTRSRR